MNDVREEAWEGLKEGSPGEKEQQVQMPCAEYQHGAFEDQL